MQAPDQGWLPAQQPLAVLSSAFISVVLLVVAATLVSFLVLRDTQRLVEEVVTDRNLKIDIARQMHNLARERSILLHQMVVEEDPFVRDDMFMRMRSIGETFLGLRERLAAMPLGPKERELLDEQASNTNIAGGRQYRVIDLINEGRQQEALRVLISEAIPAQNKAMAAIDALVELNQSYNRQVFAQVTTRVNNMEGTILLIQGIMVLLVAVIAIYVWRRAKVMFALLEESREALAQANAELRVREQTERAIRENVIDAIITINRHGKITSCNRAVEDIFGYSKEELVGRDVSLLMPEPDRSRHAEYVDNYVKSGEARIIGIGREVEGLRKDGSIVPIMLGVTEVLTDAGRLFVGVMRDITKAREAQIRLQHAHDELEKRVGERTAELQVVNQRLRKEIEGHQQTQEQLRRLANYDHQTELPNRVLFSELLRMNLAQAHRARQQLALLYIDLDGFKRINDTLGHDAGDTLLESVANRLRHLLREEDRVARIGGDEFTVILGPVDDVRHEASEVAEKIIAALARPFELCGQAERIGASIGISVYPLDSDDRALLQRHADQAMYQAKQAGRNGYRFFGQGGPG